MGRDGGLSQARFLHQVPHSGFTAGQAPHDGQASGIGQGVEQGHGRGQAGRTTSVRHDPILSPKSD